MEDPTPTLQGDNQDTLSGGGAYDVTTKDPFKDMTERVLTLEYEDTTHSQAMEEGETDASCHSFFQNISHHQFININNFEDPRGLRK